MSLFDQLHPDWQRELGHLRSNFERLDAYIGSRSITPSYSQVVRALNTSIEEIRVVIFGQDPYPTFGHANGLAFSVAHTVKPLPPSLRNIFEELSRDCDLPVRTDGDLAHWADQGVLLLNRILTTEIGASLVHEKLGWQIITDEIARILGARSVIAILWGRKAQELSSYFAPKLRISSAHPSPLSAYRGFFGSRPFSTCNELLHAQGRERIFW